MNQDLIFSLVGVMSMDGWAAILLSPLIPVWADRIAGVAGQDNDPKLSASPRCFAPPQIHLRMVAMGYVTSLFARKVVAAAGDAIDGAAFLRGAGIDPEGAWDPKAMIPDGLYYGMLERIAAEVDVTDLPLRVGASMRLDEYGALGLAFKAATTLGASYARVERYARLWTSVVEYELRPDPRGTLFILHREGARRLGMRLSNEATLASSVSIARQVSPVPVAPLEVLIRHPAPRSVAAHEDWFGSPVRFDAERDAILFSRETLAQPNILGDVGISRYLADHLERELSEIADEVPLVTRTKEAIAQALSAGAPKMAEIARDLGLSARSFHRRLSEHGMSFQTLTEETRRDLAEGLLRDDRHSLAEIAFLTGFAEQSSFTRAFKRWVGMTPASYRKERVGR
nr:AraC family transcriptional regulator [Ruegeria pomeroyi]